MKREIEKVVRIGTVKDAENPNTRSIDVFAKVVYRDGRLSISGVEGPRANGNASGGCGQIVHHLTHDDITPAPAWDRRLVARFLETWRRWHLNDMKAGCEHQRAEWDETERLEVVKYELTTAAYTRQNAIKEDIIAQAKSGACITLSEWDKAVLALPMDTHTAPDADSPASGMYGVKRRDSRPACQVTPDEHPRGLLGKKCPVCGHAYGTRWLKEEVPVEVLDFLAGLPETDKTPAWV